jgi:hypothetical protein
VITDLRGEQQAERGAQIEEECEILPIADFLHLPNLELVGCYAVKDWL